MPYRIAGAFELTIRARPAPWGATEVPTDGEAFLRWAVAAAQRAGFEVKHAVAIEDGVRLVALASVPRAVSELRRWTPTLYARPLHRVAEYIHAAARIEREASRRGASLRSV